MIVTPALAWTLTIWFAALGIVSLRGLLRSHGVTERVSYAAHIAMCIAMAMMPWAWAMSIPAMVWIALFTVAAAWYAWLALFHPDADAGPGGGHHSGALLLWYHAVMMGAMAWMSVVATMLDDAAGGHMGGAHGMPGMPGMTDASGATPGAVASAPTGLWALPPWALVVTVLVVAVFAAAAVWFFVRVLVEPARPPGRGGLPSLVEILLSLAMAIGMGASFLLLS